MSTIEVNNELLLEMVDKIKDIGNLKREVEYLKSQIKAEHQETRAVIKEEGQKTRAHFVTVVKELKECFLTAIKEVLMKWKDTFMSL